LAGPAQFPELLNDRYGFSIVLVYVLKETPFLAVLCLAVLARIDADLYSAARTLGASPWQRLRSITLPLVWPALAAGSLVVFAFIVSAFEVPYLMGRPYPSMLGVVAQRKFTSVDLAERPEAMAVAMAGTAISLIVILAAYAVQRRSAYRLPQP
jgi:putative spermidine/putrescine transport system permease protein